MKYIFLYILACLFTVNAVAQSIRPTVAVLGDSYSTFEKYIPDTNKTYYTTTDWSKTGVVKCETDVVVAGHQESRFQVGSKRLL